MQQNSGFAKSCWQMNNKARNPVWMLHGACAPFSIAVWVIARIFSCHTKRREESSMVTQPKCVLHLSSGRNA